MSYFLKCKQCNSNDVILRELYTFVKGCVVITRFDYVCNNPDCLAGEFALGIIVNNGEICYYYDVVTFNDAVCKLGQ